MSVVKDVMDDTHCKAKRIAYNSVVRMHDSRGWRKMCVRRDFGKTNTRGGFGAGYIDKGTGGVTGIRENRKSYYRRKVLTRGGGGD